MTEAQMSHHVMDRLLHDFKEGVYLDPEEIEKLVNYANAMRGAGPHGVAIYDALWIMLEKMGIFKCTRCGGFKLIEVFIGEVKYGPSLIDCPTCLSTGWTRTKAVGPWNGARHE